MAMALAMENLLPAQARKISVSFVSDIGPSVIEPAQSNPIQLDPALKALQQKILRLQVSQVVLGLTLMVISTVAILEDRVLLGLGFGLISALVAVSSAAIGIKQVNLRIVAICNILALILLFPSIYFVFENLIRHSRLYIRSYPPHPHGVGPGGGGGLRQHDLSHITRGGGGGFSGRLPDHHRTNMTSRYNEEGEKSNSTLWILCWLELAHLVPLSVSILYLLFLYRYLNYYTHF